MISPRTVAIWALVFICSHLTQAQEANYEFRKNVMIPMSDGTQLAANLFIPKSDGPFPTILIRSPYGKFDQNFGEGKKYAEAGYAMVIQDCRGRGDSQGIWDPFRYDAEDGFDTQEWVGKQPWSNGSIGTAGGSYVGWTQWASAPKGSSYLKAMVPVVPFCNVYHDISYPGGAYQLALCMGWGAAVGGIQFDPRIHSKALDYLPLSNWDDQFDKQVFYLEDWVENSTYNDYWKARGIDGHYADVTVPILNIGGWYDIFSKTTLEMISEVRKQSKDRMARRSQFAIVGPWGHGVGGSKLGELEFGDAAKLDVGKLQMEWFDFWLKETETGVESWPAYRVFVMGENRWRESDQWPLKETVYTPFYFSGDGKANQPDGDGLLSTEKPETGNEDRYVYDPANPVPTVGGNNLVGPPAGPYDQSNVSAREDVLSYTSTPLTEKLEVTGPVKVILYAASSATDTDFTAKLIDIHPNGKGYNLCDGIIRARFRESFTEPSLIQPNQVHRYEIDLWVTSNVFLPGHRIRVDVTSSNFPRFDRNPNSGKPFGTDTELFKANQTVFHGGERASHVLLPVILN